MLTIHPATPADAADVVWIGEAVRFRPDTADGAQGYLVHVRTADEYSRYLAGPHHSVVARDGDQVVGFLLAVDERGQSQSCTDPQAGLAGPGTILMDQIAVLPAYKGQGVAGKMYDALVAASQPPRLTAAIMHAPVRNERSIRFFTGRNGWRYTGEHAEGPYRWGTYERLLP